MDAPCPIQFCTLNPRSLKEREQLVSAGCTPKDCLGRCSLCFDTRFVLADNVVVEGDDYATVIERARAYCDKRAAAR
jgi:uncharacterized protein YuzB (UPF0349 family)|tara:strand:- start:11439 stop:11669 length:231 start_codon:yes stop_codon:yes gene_type:complete